jgi:hypothetical protein
MTEGTLTAVPCPAIFPTGSVPCLYCSSDIEVESFRSWSTGSRLSSASCGVCGRRVTLTTDSLRELTGVSRLAGL